MPESSNHSLFFLENDGKLGGNQLPDGSIGLSSLRRRRTICPSVSHEPLPEFPLTLLFQAFSRVFPRVALTQTHSQDHGQWQVCCVCCACVVVYCGKTLKTRGNREKCVWYGVCAVWCCEVRKYTKTRETLGKTSKHGLFFGTIWPPTDPQKVQNWPFSPTHCFLRFPWDLPTILARGPNPNAQKRRFLPKVPNPKVLIMRWKRS